MNKNEIKNECSELLLGVKLIHLVLEDDQPGSGDVMIDTLMEELEKLRKNTGVPAAARLCKEPVRKVEVSPAAGYTRYIGTKIVKATPAWRVTTEDGRKYIRLKSDDSDFAGKIEDGYKVIYSDGYESWSPKEVFEEAYYPTDGMNFGLALEAAKMDKRITRRGWNGKDMYVFLADVGELHADADLSEFEDRDVEVSELLVLRTAQGTLQPGWLATQSDMLADDWYILE